MTLEEAIKQKKFDNEFEKLMVNILFTSGWVSTQNAALLKPYKISGQQYNILRILRGQHPQPATVNLLIERMLDKMSNASRLVEKLRQKGLVERKECPADRRQVDVLITDAGLKLLAEMDVKNKQFIENIQTLSVEEAKQLNQLLDKYRG